MEKFKTLWESKDSRMYTIIFAYGGRKFRVYCEHTDGIPLGFNYNCCLAIMTSEGTFSNIIDNIQVGVEWERQCYNNKEKEKENNDRALKAFQEFVEKVY